MKRTLMAFVIFSIGLSLAGIQVSQAGLVRRGDVSKVYEKMLRDTITSVNANGRAAAATPYIKRWDANRDGFIDKREVTGLESELSTMGRPAAKAAAARPAAEAAGATTRYKDGY